MSSVTETSGNGHHVSTAARLPERGPEQLPRPSGQPLAFAGVPAPALCGPAGNRDARGRGGQRGLCRQPALQVGCVAAEGGTSNVQTGSPGGGCTRRVPRARPQAGGGRGQGPHDRSSGRTSTGPVAQGCGHRRLSEGGTDHRGGRGPSREQGSPTPQACESPANVTGLLRFSPSFLA